tara:strand:+ start:8839 stop:9015 length:177 start_codon:yes stop_codon:yes gene_type:complete
MSHSPCVFEDKKSNHIGDAIVADSVDVVRAANKVYARELGNTFIEVEAPQVSMIYAAQ